MSAPKKIKLTKQTTLNSFLTTRQDVNTDAQDSLLAEDCDNETTWCQRSRDETASTSTSNLSSTEEDPISFEKGRAEIGNVFNFHRHFQNKSFVIYLLNQ